MWKDYGLSRICESFHLNLEKFTIADTRMQLHCITYHHITCTLFTISLHVHFLPSHYIYITYHHITHTFLSITLHVHFLVSPSIVWWKLWVLTIGLFIFLQSFLNCSMVGPFQEISTSGSCISIYHFRGNRRGGYYFSLKVVAGEGEYIWAISGAIGNKQVLWTPTFFIRCASVQFLMGIFLQNMTAMPRLFQRLPPSRIMRWPMFSGSGSDFGELGLIPCISIVWPHREIILGRTWGYLRVRNGIRPYNLQNKHWNTTALLHTLWWTTC